MQVDPPPVVVEQPKLTPKGAYGAATVLSLVVLVLSQVLAAPLLMVGFFQGVWSGAFFGPVSQCTVTVKPELPDVAGFKADLQKRLPGTEVQVTGKGTELVIVVKSKSGHSNPLEYQQKLNETLSAQSIVPADTVPFSIPMGSINERDLLTNPWILIGGLIGIQGAIWVVWRAAGKKFFKGNRTLPPLHEGPLGPKIWLGLGFGIALFLVSSVLLSLLNAAFREPEDSMWTIIKELPPFAVTVVLFQGVVLAPILEEVFFRGMLLGVFRLVERPWAGVAVSSALFGMAHMQGVATVLSIMVMGAFLGLLALKTRSIVPGIVAHFVNNALSFGLLLAGTDFPPR